MRKPELGFLVGLAILTAVTARADTTATPGAGVNLGDAVVGTVHYPGSAASIQTLTAWTSATGGGTTQNLFTASGNSTGGWPAVLLQLNQTTTLTGGAITIQGTFDGTNWVSIPIAQIINPNTLVSLPANPYILQASTNQPLLILTQGYQGVRINLSTVITGSATVTPFVTLLPYNPVESGILQSTSISQTSPGTTNGVSIASDFGIATSGTTAVAGAAVSNVVAKNSAGNLQNAYVTSSAAGWVFIINAGSMPGNATLTAGLGSGNLQDCFELIKGNIDYSASINYNPGPWEHFTSGIVVAISSTDCPVLTAATTSKFIHANTQ